MRRCQAAAEDRVSFDLILGLALSVGAISLVSSPFDDVRAVYHELATFWLASSVKSWSRSRVLGITKDTFPGIKEDPQSLNRYVYVEDNPLSRTDPTGNCDVVYACSPNTAPPPPSSSSPSSSSTGAGLPVYAGGGTTGYAQGTGGGETSPTPAPSAPPPIPCVYGCPGASTFGGGSSSPATTSDTSTSSRPGKLWTPMQTDFLSPDFVSPSGPLISTPGFSGAFLTVGVEAFTIGVFAALASGPLEILALGAAAFATGYSLGYVVTAGPSATPRGALNAFGQGVGLEASAVRRAFGWLRLRPIPPVFWP